MEVREDHLRLDEVVQALQQLHQPESAPWHMELETTPSGRVGGFIIAEQFEGMSQKDRQQMIWSHLRTVLPKAKHGKLTALITLTPAEADFAA